MFKCKFCGSDFKPNYRIGKKSIHFCGKSCKSKFQRQGFFNKTQLENKIKKLILNKQCYLTKEEILQELNISSKTLSKFRVSTLQLNRDCGMKKPYSVFEKKSIDVLVNIYPDLVCQMTFDDCISPKGFHLKFDVYVPSAKILIELDGEQHKDPNHIYSTEYTRVCDVIKDNFAQQKNIRLVRIPYTRTVSEKYIKQYLKPS